MQSGIAARGGNFCIGISAAGIGIMLNESDSKGKWEDGLPCFW